MATPSDGGGCIVMREASNGGASGRVCGYAATKFPASRISAANVNAAFHQDFQGIAILRRVRSFEWKFRQGIYLHPCARVSNQKYALNNSHWNSVFVPLNFL
jgi:hypothetical protein